jgi:hypothetical protein
MSFVFVRENQNLCFLKELVQDNAKLESTVRYMIESVSVQVSSAGKHFILATPSVKPRLT